MDRDRRWDRTRRGYDACVRGLAKPAGSALEGIARQPEAAGKIQTAMIIGLALIESLVIYALLISLILLFLGVPSAEKIMKIVGK